MRKSYLLILLVIISLMAVISMRNAGSSESVAGNVRTSALATEAAEIALRFCENSVVALANASGTSPPLALPNILAASTPPKWQDISTTTGWDSTGTVAFALPLSLVNQTSVTMITYQRPPECMVERQTVVLAGVSNTTSYYVITARGFGPEVAQAGIPQGTEVWLQSHIQIGTP